MPSIYEVNLSTKRATLMGRLTPQDEPITTHFSLVDLTPIGNPHNITSRDPIDFYLAALATLPEGTNAFNRRSGLFECLGFWRPPHLVQYYSLRIS